MNYDDLMEAYPLHWPPLRMRTPAAKRKRAAFHSTSRRPTSRGDGSTYWTRQTKALSVAVARDRILKEIGAFTISGRSWVIDPSGVVISTNVRTRNDGLPYSNLRDPDDPGAAVYFKMNRQPHCLSCDKWDRVADNLNAIAKHLEAMRGQLRWGVADVAQMFAGFKALPGPIITPAPMSVEQARTFLSAHGGDYRTAAKKLHPDVGGSNADWLRLQQAKEVIEQQQGSA